MQEELFVKIKKVHPDAVIPQYAKFGDAGMDLTAVSKTIDIKSGGICFGTGLAIEIPKGYVGLLFPRSSIKNIDYSLTNAIGCVDAGYRGEIMLVFKPTLKLDVSEPMSPYPVIAGQMLTDFNEYEVGDRICQLVILPFPKVIFKEVEELSPSERGEGGYGSTGK